MTDGRATRWDEHNIRRRRELVTDALKAIRHHGAGVGMDDIAAYAQTSKTVYYRHFKDRTGLYEAIVERVHDFLIASLDVASSTPENPCQLIGDLADNYLTLVERDPEIYTFVTTSTATDSTIPVAGITTRIGCEISEFMRAWLREHGRDEQMANTWGHGVVGFVWAVADRWIMTGFDRPRHDVVAYIRAFVRPVLDAT